LATIGGVTAMSIPILWSWLNLPSLSQIVVTSLVVLDRDGASTHFRGLERVLGCLAGGAGGLLTIRLGPDSFFIWSVMLIAGVFLFSLIHHSTSRWAYVGTQGGVAFILALVTRIGPPDSILPAVNRLPGCSVGSGFYFACAWSLVMWAAVIRRATRNQTSSINDSHAPVSSHHCSVYPCLLEHPLQKCPGGPTFHRFVDILPVPALILAGEIRGFDLVVRLTEGRAETGYNGCCQAPMRTDQTEVFWQKLRPHIEEFRSCLRTSLGLTQNVFM